MVKAFANKDWMQRKDFASFDAYYGYLKEKLPVLEPMDMPQKVNYQAVGITVLKNEIGSREEIELTDTFMEQAALCRMEPEEQLAVIEAFKQSGYTRVEIKQYLQGLLPENDMLRLRAALLASLQKHCPDRDPVRLRELLRGWRAASLDETHRAAAGMYREELQEDVSCFAFTQYLFNEQWEKLFAYAKEQGIKIIGDIPIYVTLDSCDVWLNPELFQLDESYAPTCVAGCPPDGFSEDGQLWGNPLYDWPKHEADGFAWWIARVKASARFFDVIRFDHFRGLESYWSVPFGEATARNGKWVKGPGMKLVKALREGVPEVDFIAEDLGYQTPEVEQLLKDSGFPGMKVLEFAFYGDNGDYLPHNHTQNSVCYIGTHDNYTLAQWLDEEDEEIVEKAVKYLALTKEEGYIRGFLRSGMGSVSKLFVAQMQDWLELGAEARMNAPGELSTSNWSWRLKELPDKKLAAEILEMTKRYARTGEPVHA